MFHYSRNNNNFCILSSGRNVFANHLGRRAEQTGLVLRLHREIPGAVQLSTALRSETDSLPTAEGEIFQNFKILEAGIL